MSEKSNQGWVKVNMLTFLYFQLILTNYFRNIRRFFEHVYLIVVQLFLYKKKTVFCVSMVLSRMHNIWTKINVSNNFTTADLTLALFINGHISYFNLNIN